MTGLAGIACLIGSSIAGAETFSVQFTTSEVVSFVLPNLSQVGSVTPTYDVSYSLDIANAAYPFASNSVDITQFSYTQQAGTTASNTIPLSPYAAGTFALSLTNKSASLASPTGPLAFSGVTGLVSTTSFNFARTGNYQWTPDATAAGAGVPSGSLDVSTLGLTTKQMVAQVSFSNTQLELNVGALSLTTPFTFPLNGSGAGIPVSEQSGYVTSPARTIPWVNSGWATSLDLERTSTAAHWQGAGLGGASDIVRFGPVNTAGPTTVLVDQVLTTRRLLFDGANAYRLREVDLPTNGFSLIAAIDGFARISSKTSSAEVLAPVTVNAAKGVVIDAASPIQINWLINPSWDGGNDLPAASRRTLIKRGNSTATLAAPTAYDLSLEAGRIALISGNGTENVVPVITRITSATAGTLELSSGRLVINYTAGNLATEGPGEIRAVLRESLLRGWAYVEGGTTNAFITAPGLTSDPRKRVGYAEAYDVLQVGQGTWFGRRIDSSTLLLRVTLAADADLNGAVNFDDLLDVAQHYGQTNTQWSSGDFDYDGSTGFADLLLLAQNYGLSSLDSAMSATFSDEFIRDFELARSLVPEPVAASFLATATALARRRRQASRS